MKKWQQSIGRDAAVALYDGGWWKDKTAREIAEFQMHTAELCLPFGEFHKAMEETLGRPVWTHEFGLDADGLLAELMGERPAPTFTQVLALIPEEKRLVAVVDEVKQ
jgi:hypothetical protein